MDLRRIRHFVVLAETLNFRRAAERLHMAQPPLSVSIQKLESELGTKLFVRETTGVTLTPSGRAVLVEARKLLFHGTQLAETARSAVEGTGGTLRIGFVGTTTWGMLQRLVPAFRAEYPGVELELREATSVSIVQQLEDHRLDIGLVRTPLLQPTSAALVPLEEDLFVAALPRGHALAGKGPLRLAELASETFVMYAASSAPGLHSAALLACQEAGFLPRVSQQAVQVQTLLALVESGLGVALVPSVMQRYASDKIVYRPLTDVSASAAIGLALVHLPEAELAAAARFRELALRQMAR
ncbi:LysR family transcriptional regulator [Ramlibacter alkalitolerans]|uniref:LysR family transcriptional regulator n=1 Tax=Ramlibacter alkalitolerans TaxID=2039631 RepID=A0ABS1JP48_9BURK|nr:LysR family transcriptional regulator [Ramlibacter alkalitolerans]MBL0425295.1 LysR family transcriptional regulator [Ramlibacter alkalitolerans]